MSHKFEINASLRQDLGTTIARRLRRRHDEIPAIIYGGGENPQPIKISHQEMYLALENEAIFSHILKLNVNGKQEQVVLKNVQRHVYKPKILHVDFLRIRASEKITVSVPIHLENEDQAPGLKAGGMISRALTEIEIQCLPSELPEFISIDIGNLNVDETLHLSDLKLPNGVTLAGPELNDKHNLMVVSIHLSKVQESEAKSESSSEEKK